MVNQKQTRQDKVRTLERVARENLQGMFVHNMTTPEGYRQFCRDYGENITFDKMRISGLFRSINPDYIAI